MEEWKKKWRKLIDPFQLETCRKKKTITSHFFPPQDQILSGVVDQSFQKYNNELGTIPEDSGRFCKILKVSGSFWKIPVKNKYRNKKILPHPGKKKSGNRGQSSNVQEENSVKIQGKS